MALKSEGTVTPGIIMSDLSMVEEGTRKRSVIGIFDHFMFPQFPVQIGRFWITAWVTNLSGTLSSIDLTTRIEEKGSAHVVFSNSMRQEFPQEMVLEPTQVIALNTPITGIVFQKPGIYTIVLLLNADKVGERDIHVKLVPQSQNAL